MKSAATLASLVLAIALGASTPITGAAAVGATAGTAPPNPQTIVDERVAIIKGFTATLAAAADAAQGKGTLAAAKVKLAAARAGVKRLTELFSFGTAHGDPGVTKSRALSKIWDTRAEFDLWLDELGGVFALLDWSFAVDEKTREFIAGTERTICKSCHDKYRAPQD